MEESFELLSTMSPKLQKHKHPNKKIGVTRMALKKSFRRSQQLDHLVSTKNEQLQLAPQESTSGSSDFSEIEGQDIALEHTVPETDIENIDDSIERPRPNLNDFPEVKRYFDSFCGEEFSEKQEIGDNEPVVIEDSICELNECDNKTKFTEINMDILNQYSPSDCDYEEANKLRIKRWISDIHRSFNTEAVGDVVNISSEKEDEKFKSESENSVEIVLSSPESPKTDKKISEKVHDDLYASSWKENEAYLTRSVPKPKKKSVLPIEVPQTEIKPNNRLKAHNALFRTTKMVLSLESPSSTTLKNNLENTFNWQENSKSIADNSKSISLDETESFLDQIYGNDWRSNREKILTPILVKTKSSTIDRSGSPELPDMRYVTPRRKYKKGDDDLMDIWRPDLTQENLETEEENMAIGLVAGSKYSSKDSMQANNSFNSLELNTSPSPIKNVKLNPLQSTDSNNPSSCPLELNEEHLSYFNESVEDSFRNLRVSVCGKKLKKKFVFESSDSETDTEKSVGGSPAPSLKTRQQMICQPVLPCNKTDSDTESTDLDTELKNFNDILYQRTIDTDNNDDNGKKNLFKVPKPLRTNRKKKKSENLPIREDEVEKSSCHTKYPSFLSSLSVCVNVQDIKLKYRPYRTSYQIHKDDLANKLFKYFNIKVFDEKIPSDTLIEWSDRMTNTAGFCYCKKITRRTGAIERNCRIVLASKILDSPDRLRDTLIHEMCHAATWIVNEIADGHGHFWKTWATKAMVKFPELPPIRTCHNYAINTKYSYVCSKCNYTIGRHSKSLNIETKRCGYCFGKFEVFINKKKGGKSVRVPSSTRKELTGFALFVKDNYSKVKTSDTSHAEVMRILGQKFADLKVKE